MLSYWTHNLDPLAIKFPSGFPLPGIRWYGIAYGLGFMGAWAQLHLYRKRRRLTLSGSQGQDLLFYLFMGLLLGGRLGYVLLYESSYFRRFPQKIFSIWEGGMASHGAFVGISLALWLFGRRHHFSLLSLGDLTVTLAPVGIFLGRIGNFINGELYGRVTTVPWGIIFSDKPRHPSQLYEAFGEGLLLFFYTQYRLWETPVVFKRPGSLAAEFLTLYGLVRMICEIFREPDAALLYGLSRGQFYSLFCVIIGVTIRVYASTVRPSNLFKIPS
ncbi:MAG: prolipoprotein diacylglyceryl transferase [Puniceicoccales bacterium]|nr:prolipoprotein diacylglyceryl transferase [Puniceicoccales bacterium]